MDIARKRHASLLANGTSKHISYGVGSTGVQQMYVLYEFWMNHSEENLNQ